MAQGDVEWRGDAETDLSVEGLEPFLDRQESGDDVQGDVTMKNSTVALVRQAELSPREMAGFLLNAYIGFDLQTTGEILLKGKGLPKRQYSTAANAVHRARKKLRAARVSLDMTGGLT